VTDTAEKTAQVETQAKKDTVKVAVASEIPATNLEASVVQSDTAGTTPHSSFMPMIVSFLFIGASAGAVYFIRTKKVISKAGDDFKILDE
jgi:hypothetical protein